MNYVLGTVTPGPRAAVLGGLQEVEDDYELMQGVPRADGFPDEAYFQMSDNFPQNLLLEDFLDNQNRLLVVSERVREGLAGLPGNEFLPVRILNHKGREEPERYYVLHQVGLQDCIDYEASDYIENEIDRERIYYMNRLVVQEDRVDPEARLFRMRRFAKVPVFRRDLAAEVEAAGYTGIRFDEIDAFEGS